MTAEDYSYFLIYIYIYKFFSADEISFKIMFRSRA